MRNVYIAFSKPKEFKIGASSISVWMNRPYSHALFIFEYENSKPAVFQASHGMVHFKSLKNFQDENEIVKAYKIQLTEEEHDALFDDCMDLAGLPYATMNLAKIIGTDIVYNITGHYMNVSSSKGYICSQLVGRFCVNKLKLTFDRPLPLVKPSNVDLALEQGNYPLALVQF